MKRWLLAAVICAFAPSAALAVTFVEGADISGTPSDDMFTLDLGLNTFEGLVDATPGGVVCTDLGSGIIGCANTFTADIDGFQAKAGPGQVITSVLYSLGSAVTPDAASNRPTRAIVAPRAIR